MTRRTAAEITPVEQTPALAADGQAAIAAFREVQTNPDRGVIIAMRGGGENLDSCA